MNPPPGPRAEGAAATPSLYDQTKEKHKTKKEELGENEKQSYVL